MSGERKTFRDYGIEIPYRRTSGNVKTFCPNCRERRTDKRDKSLSVNLDTGVWNCHYCGWSGHLEYTEEAKAEWVKDQPWYGEHLHDGARSRKEYRRPEPRPDNGYSAKLEAWLRLERGISPETARGMGVTEGPEFMPQTKKVMNTLQFNYYRDGVLVNTKFRDGGKRFKFVQGAELIPYNLDGIKGTRECIITEGEMDALAFAECGRTDVVSAPAGANANLSWLDDCMEGWFDGKDTIYIAADSDSKGAVLRDELVRRLGPERCRIVTYGDGCKDADEHLVKYGKASLLERLAAAREVKVEGVFTVPDFEDALDNLYERGMQKGVTVGHPNLDSLLSLETKRLLVVTGIPGSGKSEFIDEMAERLNIRYGWRFAYFSPENFPLEYHASKLIEKATGSRFGVKNTGRDIYTRAKEWLGRDFAFIAPSEGYRLDGILERAEYLVRRKGIKALVIDPYNRLEDDTGYGSETQYVSRLLDKLLNFAQRNDVLVILMAHPTKMRKAPGEKAAPIPNLYDISGSAHFFNKADFGICVHRDREADEVHIYVQKVKFRHLGECGVAKFRYNVNNGRYTPYDGYSDPQWDNSDHLLHGLPGQLGGHGGVDDGFDGRLHMEGDYPDYHADMPY